jgi:hypothetical protein
MSVDTLLMSGFIIKHKKTGLFMPEVRTKGGYSHWNPDNPKMPDIFRDVPRLFMTEKRAKQCIVQWFVCQNGRRSMHQSRDGEWDDIVDIKLDGRTKEDLEVIKVEIMY